MLLGIAFFLLRDEIEQLKTTVDAANELAVKVEKLNKELDRFKIKFNQLDEDNKKFQESTTRYIQNSTSILMEMKNGQVNR